MTSPLHPSNAHELEQIARELGAPVLRPLRSGMLTQRPAGVPGAGDGRLGDRG